jgi:molecular chaperone DnaJ
MVKNYYETLGVERGTGAEEIKKAYRGLAQQWHPDKHQSASEEERHGAEEKFKEISEAYAVLSDPEKRNNYDTTGSPEGHGPFGFQAHGDPMDMLRNFGMRFRQGPRVPQPMKGQTLQDTLNITLEEALFSSEKSVNYSVTSGCSGCNGAGGKEFSNCSECRGSGGVTRVDGPMVMHTTCHVCQGMGKRVSKVCDVCDGKRVVNEDKKLSVIIPGGVKHRAVLRVSGVGGRGLLGGPPGDVLLSINIHYPDVSMLSEEEREQLKTLLSK